MVELEDLNPLNKLVNESVKQVSEDLTQMTNMETHSKISRISQIDIEEFGEGLTSNQRVASFVQISGDLEGFLIILLKPDSAKKVADSMLADMGMEGDKDNDEFSEMERSALMEVGNILTSSFVDGMANASNSEINSSPPQFANDMVGAIIDPALSMLAEETETVISMDSELETSEQEIEYRVFLFTNTSTLEDFINKL